MFLVAGLALVGTGCETAPERDAEAARFDAPRIGANLELLKEADKLFGARKYEEAKRTYARAARASGPNSGYVEACSQVARCESLLGTPLEGEPWLRMAAGRASASEPMGWSRLQAVLGIYEREDGQRVAATKRFTSLYDYCLKYELYERAIDAAHHVVLASPSMEVQLEWSKKGIEAAERGGMQGWLAVLWNNLGASLEDQERYEDALVAYEEARRYHDESGDEHAQLVADWAVGHAQRLAGRLEDARITLEEVHAWALERYQANPSPERAEWVGYSDWDLGELQVLEGDLAGGRGRLVRARASLIEAGIEDWGAFGTKELGRLDARLAKLASELP